MSTSFMRIHPDDLLAIVDGVVAAVAIGAPVTTARWLSTSDVAAAFGRSQEWVRDHAVELGGRKIGGPRAPWRFPMSCIDRVEHAGAGPAEQPRPTRRRRVTTPGVTLLPIRN